jgi:hypothetical protein
MCLCNDICYYYELLIRHNTELKKSLCKYINVVEAYICTLSGIRDESIRMIDPNLIKPPSELIEVAHNLLTDNDDYMIECECNDEKNKYTVFVLVIYECENSNENRCNKSCNRSCSYVFKKKNVSCLAKYCDKYGNMVQLCAEDIPTNVCGSSVNEQINKYIGFKQFLQDLVEVL